LIDFNQLLKIRVVVARMGEMDNARWWNTGGQLATMGPLVLRRNFPRSHRFAAAKSVFAVAKARCNEIFNPPMSMTLWNLPALVEEQFDANWERWIEERDAWEPFLLHVAEIKGSDDLAGALRELQLIVPGDEDLIAKAKRSAEGRAVQLSGVHSPSDDVLRLLALGFAKGEPGSLTVPYARLED
jgi:hypothetical protein